MNENKEFTEDNMSSIDYIMIELYRSDALARVLLDKGIITKEELNKKIIERSELRKNTEIADSEIIDKLTKLAQFE